MTNVHSLKAKKKNIMRKLGKLYQQKHTTTEQIKELEEARTKVVAQLHVEREKGKKKK